ncbi:MAG: VWD domain-containing protein [Patulibacter minatonensis]
MPSALRRLLRGIPAAVAYALAALLLALAAAAPAGAAPVALGKDDLPGAKPATTSAKAFRTAFTAGMRGGPRSAVRRAPVRATAWTFGPARVLTGSAQFANASIARAALKAARARTTVGAKTSRATASVRVGQLVGFVRVDVKARDRSVRAAADAYARTLEGVLDAAASATVADTLAENATGTKANALALFSIAYGKMPGAKVPAGPRGEVGSGTLALRRVYRLWAQLSPAQRAAFDRAAGNTTAVPVATGGRAHRSGVEPSQLTARRLALTPDPTAQALANGFLAAYLDPSRMGNVAGPVVKVYRSSLSIGGGATADSFPVNAQGKGPELQNPAECRIRLDPKYYAKETAAGKAFAVAHEVFHCVEFRVTDNWQGNSRDWVIEGLANWAAFQVTPPATDTLGYGHYVDYLKHPGTPLFKQSYRAVGFWGHQHQRLGNLWPRVGFILHGGSDPATYDTALGNDDASRLTGASHYLRDPGAGAAWTTTQPLAVGDAQAHTPRASSAANGATIKAAAHTSKLVDLVPTPKRPVVSVFRTGGNVRFTDGTYDFEDKGAQYFCLGATCECPPGESGDFPTPMSTVSRVTAALYGETSGAQLAITRRPVKDFCKKDEDPPRIGPSGGGGSNGDPHLTSLDGLKYDFQAAGEFVLARSGGDLEVQARQEPWKIGKTVIRTVTINTQLALKIGASRVTFTAGEPPQVRVDGGAPQTIAPGAQVNVGAGRITGQRDGQSVVAWPDGSRATVFPVGEWGLAFTLDLADARKGKVTGLLGDFDGAPADDLRTRGGKVIAYTARAASWPGLARVSIDDPTDPKFADKLYDDLGDSWRLTQAESLLDYAKGQTTKTFTDQSIPRKLIDPADLSASKRQAAEATCRAAGVTAPAALEDCILDVALTGQSAFATAIAQEQALTALTTIGWQRLAAGATRFGPVSLARTGDGTLQMVWEDKDAAGKRSVVAGGLPAAGGERPVVPVAPFDTTPYAFTAPDGTLRTVGAVIDTGPPVTEGIVQFGALAPFDSWGARPMIVSGGAYVGEPMSTFVGNTMLTVSGLAGNGKVYRDTGVPTGGGTLLNGALSADCYAMKPAIASSGGETYAAWWQWDCPQTGLYVAAIDPATGKPGEPVLVPQSVWTSSIGAAAWDAPGLDRLSLAARAGGGVYLAYARQDGDAWSVLLWRVGSPAPMVVASGLRVRPDSLQVSAEPTSGALWVAWESEDAAFGKGRLSVRRTTPAADAWTGEPRAIAFPGDGDQRAAPTHPWDVLARDGALDVVAGYPASADYPGALWRGVLAG